MKEVNEIGFLCWDNEVCTILPAMNDWQVWGLLSIANRKYMPAKALKAEISILRKIQLFSRV